MTTKLAGMTMRTERLLGLLPETGVDLMLVTNLVNVRYLTGYSGSNGLALVGPGTRIFITDFRYVEQAAEEVDPDFERRRAPLELLDSVGEALPEGELRLGFEDSDLTVHQHQRLRQLLPETVELVGAGQLVERLRAVKEPPEIEAIEAASRLADEAFARVLEQGLVGRTEREVALALEWEMLALGARAPSFETIVAGGPHGALPHAKRRDVEIERGEMVVIDWGAELDGYCSDCTRTIAAGHCPDDVQEVYRLVLEAQLAGVQAVHAGAGVREVDATARAVIDSAAHAEHFGHGLGHGVGLEVHEGPRLSQRADGELQAGNVVTVEPGIYLPGRFGVRIEDLVVVTADGCEILTSVSKELTVSD
jgi:Xaa-Pro aminopeptidase